MTRRITRNDSLIYLLSYTIIAIFLYCGIYAVPSADDYFYANLTRDHGLVAAQLKHYLEWSGRYAATFFITLFSLTDYAAYWLVPWLSIAALVSSTYFFLRTMFPEVRAQVDLFQLSSAFAALFLSVATAGYGHGIAVINEGFFWFSGSITYLGGLALYLLLLSVLVRLFRGEGEWFDYPGALLLLPVVIGLNETVMFLVGLTVLPLLLLSRKRLGIARSVPLAVLVIACSLVVFLCPGNEVRMQTSDGGNLLSALGVCAEKVVQIFFYYLFNPFVWLFVLLFREKIESLYGAATTIVSRGQLLLAGFFLVYLLYLPVAYSLNAGAPDRLIAFIGYFALAVSVLAISAGYGWLITKRVSNRVLVSLLVAAALTGSYFFVEPLRIALVTTVAGKPYYRAHRQRAEYVAASRRDGDGIVTVDAIDRNRLLLFEDLLPDNDNVQYARFHGVRAVRLRKQ